MLKPGQYLFNKLFIIAGLRCFHASAVRLWNELNVDSMNISGLGKFKKHLVNKTLLVNESCDHFLVTQTF